MKTVLKLSIASLCLAIPAAKAQIEINENLSLSGFIDMSTTFGGGDTSYSLDQAELDFIFNFEGVSGQVDLDNTQSDGFNVEQAFITGDLGEGSSIGAGKFLSYMGWETFEPTGLYQFSFAYGGAIPGHHTGVFYNYEGDWGSFGVSVVDQLALLFAGDNGLNSEDLFEYGAEVKLTLTPADGWTVFLGYAMDSAGTAPDDTSLINLWASYEVGISTFAFEYNIFEAFYGDADQWLAMWSAAVSDKGTVTLRISEHDSDDVVNFVLDDDFSKYTAAYLHAVTDNLTLVFEVSEVDFDAGSSATEAAIEALFVF